MLQDINTGTPRILKSGGGNVKNFARRVTLACAATTVALGMVALAPAPSHALSDWPCNVCKAGER
jgi:hypothetical protein